MRNKFAGTCYRCGLRVEAGMGHYQLSKRNINYKFTSRWLVQHAECAIKYSGTRRCYLDDKVRNFS